MSIGRFRIGEVLARGISKLKKQQLKYNKKTILSALIILASGCFFYQLIFENYLWHNQAFPVSAADSRHYISYQSYRKQNPQWMYEGHARQKVVLGASLEKKIQGAKGELENNLENLVGDAPIKEMIPELIKLDDATMALTVGIAKKESDWGRHAPSKDGKTCYNYWGYKGVGSKGFSMGYGCFGNPEEGVRAVSGLIKKLSPTTLNNPERMVVWKCGSSCAGHDPAAVRKWVQDVSTYYHKVLGFKRGASTS